MGPKGSRIQQITRDYAVQIKFPDREENPGIPMDTCLHGSWCDHMNAVPTLCIREGVLLKICGELTSSVPHSVLEFGLSTNLALSGREDSSGR